MQIDVPQTGGSYLLPNDSLNPYTPAEWGERVQVLKERRLFIDFQKDIDGPQTAVRLVRADLGKQGVQWVEDPASAEAVVWVQGQQYMRFAFVVAHREDRNRYIAAECGPRELTATIMTGICEYFSLGQSTPVVEKSVQRVVELNRAIYGASLAENLPRAFRLMTELAAVIPELAESHEPAAIKHVVDALADAAESKLPEALELREAAHATLVKIGPSAIPWLEKGLAHSDPDVRRHCRLALRDITGHRWWQVWKS